jgi:hypothetical protein
MKNLIYLPFFLLYGLIGKNDVYIPLQTTDSEIKIDDTESDVSVDLQGAWTSYETNEKGEKITITTIVMDGYLAESFYNEKTKEFIRTFGGSWTVEKNVFSLTLEFSSADSSKVGSTRNLVFDLKGDTITFGGSDKIWTRIDDGQKGELNGAWLITGRKRDGKLVRRSPGDRKTMKILSGSRFQWIAYNTATGKFSGTGGGTYTAENGNYTENIEFFSRDKNRVGATLSFQYEIKENEWHHSGLSSKGDPIYEIWSPRIMDLNNNE